MYTIIILQVYILAYIFVPAIQHKTVILSRGMLHEENTLTTAVLIAALLGFQLLERGYSKTTNQMPLS